MLKLTNDEGFEAEVVVVQPVGKKMVRGKFWVDYNLIDAEEAETILEEDGISAYLDAIVRDVRDVEVPDGQDPREYTLKNKCCRLAIIDRYNEKTKGIERKNSKRLR